MPPRSWDIFCTVIDNYGDIGVAWRLARRLARDCGHAVRLWVDDLASFARIAPGWTRRCRNRRWPASTSVIGLKPAFPPTSSPPTR
ncbi:Uncharacterized protein conserved in bacteria [Chromobacterium violaceum]|uniref:Protein-arginine rhamnosyltransferase n=1 Tax=Chromobacterium violaceum TaxID=536 RepID=A0AAX2MBW3_CHRVL|nr:Uncharacterized protein conserved in bacteria [Chromobacterium violaceum]